jgi:argininosuccinate synthase
MSRIVFAYSGSARSSIAIRWMIEAWQVEVVTLTLDLGQRDELDAVREGGFLDERERFARDYLLKALRAGTGSDAGWPLGRLLTRPLIARRLADVARMEGVGVIAHGAWRDRDDRLRLERAMRDAGSDAIVRAPLVDADMTDAELLAFAGEHALPVQRLDRPADTNVWERCATGPTGAGEGAGAIAAGAGERAGQAGAGALDPFDLDRTSDIAATVVLEFSRGTPVGLNGVAMSLLELVSSLDTIAGAHGIGRTQQLARAIDGAVVSQRCDAPAATLLDIALRQLQRLALPADAAGDAACVSALYRDILSRGAWASPVRLGCDAFVETIQARATGTVRLRLFKGAVSVMDCAFAEEPANVAHFSR